MIRARAWPVDPSSPPSAAAGLGAQPERWHDAAVVGIGWTARTVRELHLVADGLVRLLVEREGFGAVLIEGDRAARGSPTPVDT